VAAAAASMAFGLLAHDNFGRSAADEAQQSGLRFLGHAHINFVTPQA